MVAIASTETFVEINVHIISGLITWSVEWLCWHQWNNCWWFCSCSRCKKGSGCYYCSNLGLGWSSTIGYFFLHLLKLFPALLAIALLPDSAHNNPDRLASAFSTMRWFQARLFIISTRTLYCTIGTPFWGFPRYSTRIILTCTTFPLFTLLSLQLLRSSFLLKKVTGMTIPEAIREVQEVIANTIYMTSPCMK